MVRPLRLSFENAFYHITTRGNRREKIFYSNRDKEVFLKKLGRKQGDGSSFDNKLPVVKLVAEDFSMPRTTRTKSKSKIYHIMIRGINQQNIFADDEDNEKFIAILDTYHKKVEYEI